MTIINRRNFTIFAAAVALASVLSILSLEIVHAKHDCSGAGCGICLALKTARASLRTMCASSSAALLIAARFRHEEKTRTAEKNAQTRTLITEKIKLSD